MEFEIGKIINYDNEIGEILTTNGLKCIFLKKDLKDDYENLKDEVLIFRIEESSRQKRAFYIRKLKNVIKDKKIRNEILARVSLTLNN